MQYINHWRSYAATSRVPLIIPSPANLIPFFHNDEVPAISFAYHLNSCSHSRKPRTNDQNVGSICVPAIVDGGCRIWIGHFVSKEVYFIFFLEDYLVLLDGYLVSGGARS